MKNICLLLAVTTLTGLWSCAKSDTGPDDSGLFDDPVFVIDASLDGMPVERIAGQDEQYHFTGYRLNPDDVWEFYGRFAEVSCPVVDCPGVLTFIWRNNAPGNDLDSTWSTGLFPMFRELPDTAFYRSRLSYSSDAPQAPELVWTLDDSTVVSGPTCIFDNDGAPFQVQTEAFFSNGLQSRTEQQFLPAESRICMQANLQARTDSATVLLSAVPVPPLATSYLWSTGATTPDIEVPWTPDGSYAVTIFDATYGCTAAASLQNLPEYSAPVSSGFVTGISQRIEPAFAGGPVIEWIDAQGHSWRSDRGTQPFPANHFRVLEVQDYIRNENGQPTKLLRIGWNCRLYHDSGDWKTFSGTGVIAVAWPEI